MFLVVTFETILGLVAPLNLSIVAIFKCPQQSDVAYKEYFVHTFNIFYGHFAAQITANITWTSTYN